MSEELKKKYKITHADGREVSPSNIYWVLKLNYNPTGIVTDIFESAHVKASRVAFKAYADTIKESKPNMAEEMYAKLEQFNKVEELTKKVAALNGLLEKEKEKCNF